MPPHQAAGTQSNSSQSFDTGGSETSELRPSLPRRSLVAPRGKTNYRQFRQSKTETVHLEKEDHLPDNCRLRWLQGLRRSLHPRIRLHRFRTLHHQGWGSFQQVNAPSSGSDIFTAYQSELSRVQDFTRQGHWRRICTSSARLTWDGRLCQPTI